MAIHLKRSINLRWLFDDRCYIHLRWSCSPWQTEPWPCDGIQAVTRAQRTLHFWKYSGNTFHIFITAWCKYLSSTAYLSSLMGTHMKRLLATRKRRSAQASAARYLKCVSNNDCAYIHAYIDDVFILMKLWNLVINGSTAWNLILVNILIFGKVT